jgi:hypothetical protein
MRYIVGDVQEHIGALPATEIETENQITMTNCEQ